MPLPKISTPTYELELPSTGQKIKYRPFLVKEEKVLVIALESEDTKQITTAIKTVIKNCIETKNVKIESLPTFDIEYLFLNIRGKSVGEEIEVNIICPDDGETTVGIKLSVDDIHVQKNPEHNNKIKLDDSIVMELKYPSLAQRPLNGLRAEWCAPSRGISRCDPARPPPVDSFRRARSMPPKLFRHTGRGAGSC